MNVNHHALNEICLCSDCNTHIDCAGIAAKASTYDDYRKAVLAERKAPSEPMFTDRLMGFIDGDYELALAFRNVGIVPPQVGDIERENGRADRISLYYNGNDSHKPIRWPHLSAWPFRVNFTFAQYDMGIKCGYETYFEDTVIEKGVLKDRADYPRRLKELEQRITFYNHVHSEGYSVGA